MSRDWNRVTVPMATRMQQLRDAGVSCPDIARVLTVDGQPTSTESVYKYTTTDKPHKLRGIALEVKEAGHG